MNTNIDALAVLDVERELGVKQSTKNANAGFVDWRDWCAFVGKTAEARAAFAELIEALVPVENLDVLRESGVIGDDELVCLHGSTVNKIRAALARVKGGAA